MALLSRTNANVFDEAVRVTEGEVPARIHLIGVRVRFGRLLAQGNTAHASVPRTRDHHAQRPLGLIVPTSALWLKPRPRPCCLSESCTVRPSKGSAAPKKGEGPSRGRRLCDISHIRHAR